MTPSVSSVGAYVRKLIHLGSDVATGQPIYLPAADLRSTSAFLAAASGSGKSSLIKVIARQLATYRLPHIVIDPHGDVFASALAAYRRSGAPLNQLIILDPTDLRF